MMARLHLYLLGLLHLTCYSLSVKTQYPPVMIANPPKQIIFEQGDSVMLPCVADANPSPIYRWTYNDKSFEAAGTDDAVVMQPGVGTLVFNRPRSNDQGYFKCFATNSLGVAVGDTVQMINASLGSFPDINPSPVRRTAGDPLRIICPKPESFPEADIIWQQRDTAGWIAVDYNDRITIDPDGGLNFAYLDSSENKQYRCQAYNKILRKYSTSKPWTVSVSGSVANQVFPPRTNWVARTTETFIRGREARLKCIFSGIPVPGVIWKRTDNKPISVRAQRRSYGLELYFASIEYEDEGSYECSGYNEAEPLPARVNVMVKVEGHMRWVFKPQSQTRGVNETAVFICKGEGVPVAASPKWFKNGVELSTSTDKMKIGNEYGPSTTLTVKNLENTDTMALQCNITNFLPFSWIHNSFYLNVQSESPTIVQFDDGPHKWAAGQSYNLTCKVFGAPTPIISWKKNQQSLTGGRFITNDDGTLQILDVGVTDAGQYECIASNVHGWVTKSTSVIVRRNTEIRQAPEDLTVNANTQAKFVCTALTDPDEAQNLVIRWKKDGNFIDYTENTRMFMNVQDNSLQIAGPKSLDSGSYTCSATNGIDVAEASATLRVQDRPDHPISVSIEYCLTGSFVARVKWSPGANNNAPLTNYIVQYKTNHDQSLWYTMDDSIGERKSQVDLKLKPFNTYRFRVLAQNRIGISEPSYATSDTCTTTDSTPPVNPRGVKTLDEGESKLIITWQPISPNDYGAPGFFYEVRYKPKGKACRPSQEWCIERVVALEGSLGRPGELNLIEYKLQIDNVETYTPYQFKVLSVNDNGASADPEKTYIGYSGESNPTQAVRGFAVQKRPDGEDMVYSENATFVWNAVNESDAVTKGFFRGYVIQYEKMVDQDEFFDTRSFYVVLRNVKKEGRPMAERKLDQNEVEAIENPDGTVQVTVTHLPANSDLRFKIAVINKRRYGGLSSELVIKTKEGLPGPVSQLRIIENGPTHVRLEWETPIEPNGNITQYMIGYKTINGLQLGPMQYPDTRYIPVSKLENGLVKSKVTGLKPLQMYRMFVWAYTRAGQGSEYFIDDSTVQAGYPGAPRISVERIGNRTLNVSWVPSPIGVPANVFYVQYKQESAIDQWQRTGWEVNERYILISNFVEGWRYEVRVVASNGGIYETASDSVKIFPTDVSRSASEAKEVFSSAWFIGLLVCLIILAIFIVLVCFIQQNKGGVYTGQFAVAETEPLRPYDDSYDEKTPHHHPESEAPISEKYAPSHFSDRYPPSERQAVPPPRPRNDEDDYMHDDPSKYGEEGSFLGQYGEKKELPARPARILERPEPAQPQPRARQPPSESSYATAPTPGPRSSESGSRGGPDRYAPRQPPPRSYPSQESGNEYRPRRPAPAETRYRPAPAHETDDHNDETQTVV